MSKPSKKEQCELLAFVLWVGAKGATDPKEITFDQTVIMWHNVSRVAKSIWMTNARALYDALQRASAG